MTTLATTVESESKKMGPRPNAWCSSIVVATVAAFQGLRTRGVSGDGAAQATGKRLPPAAAPLREPRGLKEPFAHSVKPERVKRGPQDCSEQEDAPEQQLARFVSGAATA